MAQTTTRYNFQFICRKPSLRTSFRLLFACILLLASMYLNGLIHKEINFSSPPRLRPQETSKSENRPMGKVLLNQPSWDSLPKFEIYIRMSSNKRYVIEYTQWFVKAFQLFFPSVLTKNSLVIGLDGENKNDHELGEKLKNSWPYPKICYNSPAENEAIYHKNQRIRSFWDQFYPEKCVTAEYVAYADSDTMFSSVVTPNSLFDGQKPIMIGRVGMPPYPSWPKGTEFMLGQKEVAGFMSYFPVIIKVDHIKSLREFVSKRFGRSFDEAFKVCHNRFAFGAPSQFAVFGNYLWYYHRDDYTFRFHLSPDNTYDGTLHFHEGMAPLNYIQQETKDLPEIWIPFPRISIHTRYLSTPQKKFLYGDVTRPEAVKELNSILKESFCYTYGFEHCSGICKEYNNSKVFHYLFQFEGMSWHWDKRCHEEQEKYILNAKSLLKEYKKSGQPIFGFNDTQNICSEVIKLIQGN